MDCRTLICEGCKEVYGFINHSYTCRQMGVMYFLGMGMAVDYVRVISILRTGSGA